MQADFQEVFKISFVPLHLWALLGLASPPLEVDLLIFPATRSAHSRVVEIHHQIATEGEKRNFKVPQVVLWLLPRAEKSVILINITEKRLPLGVDSWLVGWLVVKE